MIEVLKQMIEILEYIDEGANNQGAHTGISWRDVSNKTQPAIQAGRQAIAELESQEPVSTLWQHGKTGRYRLTTPDSITDCDAQWVKVGDFYKHQSQRTEQNFCSRCGKRTNDIHTCTPPQIKTSDSFESEKVADYNRGWNDCLFASGIVKQSQRTWQGLTDEQIWQIATDSTIGGDLHADKFAKAIEAKLKELNDHSI